MTFSCDFPTASAMKKKWKGKKKDNLRGELPKTRSQALQEMAGESVEVQQVVLAAVREGAILGATNCILFFLPCAQTLLPKEDSATISRAYAEHMTNAYTLFVPGFLCIVLYVRNKCAAFVPCGLVSRQWRCKNVKLGGKTFSVFLSRHAVSLSIAGARDSRIKSPLRAPPPEGSHPAPQEWDSYMEVQEEKVTAVQSDLAAAVARVQALEKEAVQSAARFAAAEEGASLLSRRIDELEASVKGLRPHLQAALYSARRQEQNLSTKEANESWPRPTTRL